MVSKIKLHDYTITVKHGLLSTLGKHVQKVAPAHRYAVITDSNIEMLYGESALKTFNDAQADLITIPAGESYKIRDTWANVTDRLITTGFGRDTTIIALGGGVVGDLAGFVAATFMRGVPFVQVPTTLLAMIDASVGGKTGVDTPAGKNLVGSFHQPAAVLADPQVLATLAFSELRAGFAEAIKHGVIGDALYFDSIEKALPKLISADGVQSDEMLSLITRSIEIKAGIVSRDEREQGLRKVLNFGHTVGHAVELLSGYTLLHGEAIAIGMVAESTIAEQVGIAEAGTTQRIRNLLVKAELPTEVPESMGTEEIMAAMRTDKKVREGAIEYALPKRIGEMASEANGYGVRVDDAVVRKVFERHP